MTEIVTNEQSNKWMRTVLNDVCSAVITSRADKIDVDWNDPAQSETFQKILNHINDAGRLIEHMIKGSNGKMANQVTKSQLLKLAEDLENHKKASITSLTRPIGFILANADSIAQLRGPYEEALKHNDNLNRHPNTDLVLNTNASLHDGLNGMKELIQILRGEKKMDTLMSHKINRKALLKLAESFESPENDVLDLVNDNALDKVAMVFIKAAEALKEVAEVMSSLEPGPEAITAQKLDEIAAVAESFDESGDELLQKQAATLDDLLVILGSPKNKYLFSLGKKDEKSTEDELKKKYKETLETQHKNNGIKEAVDAIEKSPVYKEYRSEEAPLSSRYCPDHFGQSTHRVAEHTVRCPLDGREYNFDEGYTLLSGNKVPGGSVENQNAMDGHNSFTAFDSRSQRMGFSAGEN